MSGFSGFPGFPGFTPFPGMGRGGGGGGSGQVDNMVGVQGDAMSREFPAGTARFPGMNNADAPRFIGVPQNIAGQLPEDIRIPPSLGSGYGGGKGGGGGGRNGGGAMLPGQGGWGGMRGFPDGGSECQCPRCRSGRGW